MEYDIHYFLRQKITLNNNKNYFSLVVSQRKNKEVPQLNQLFQHIILED